MENQELWAILIKPVVGRKGPAWKPGKRNKTRINTMKNMHEKYSYSLKLQICYWNNNSILLHMNDCQNFNSALICHWIIWNTVHSDPETAFKNLISEKNFGKLIFIKELKLYIYMYIENIFSVLSFLLCQIKNFWFCPIK